MRFTAFGFGIGTSVLINCFGNRIVLFFGGLIQAVGLLGSTYAPDPWWFCVSIGVLFGIGNNMVQTSSTLIIPQYFDEVSTYTNVGTQAKDAMRELAFQ